MDEGLHFDDESIELVLALEVVSVVLVFEERVLHTYQEAARLQLYVSFLHVELASVTSHFDSDEAEELNEKPFIRFFVAFSHESAHLLKGANENLAILSICIDEGVDL